MEPHADLCGVTTWLAYGGQVAIVKTRTEQNCDLLDVSVVLQSFAYTSQHDVTEIL
jgi:hypothetical protein